MKTLILGSYDVKKLLPMSECIGCMRELFRNLGQGEEKSPVRTIVPLKREGMLAIMPAFLGKSLGAKIITIFPQNSGTQFESHQGAVLLFEPDNGRLLAVIDSTSVTALRTAAVSAVATEALSRVDSTNLGILGAGSQARSHLEAISLVRNIKSVKVWSRNYDHARAFALQAGQDITAVPTAKEAVSDADIICTTTSSPTPVLKGEWVAQGTHINAVGAYTSTTRELDSETVKKSLLYVDSRKAALVEAGDFLIPQNEGTIPDSHIIGELRELFAGSVPGRKNAKDITLFKSLGLAIEDIYSCSALYKNALGCNLGAWVEFGKERETV